MAMTVAQRYPARTDTNGTTWYRPVQRSAGEIWGWTCEKSQADPSYFPTETVYASSGGASDGCTHPETGV